MNTATLDLDYSGMMNSWRCENCHGMTYDIHEFEIPRFCCRCGQKFDEHDYKDKLIKENK